MDPDHIFRSKVLRYGISVAAVLLATVGLQFLGDHINSTTVALTLLLIILSLATFFGRNPALVASFVAMLCFNYFFLPPVHTWTISEPQNLVAWAAFTITALVAGELSAYARRRAHESERLYEELQTAFKTATQAEALKQSERLKTALLDAVTHDLRTPLTSIKASATTLLEDLHAQAQRETSASLDDEGRKEMLEVINEESDRLDRFIEGLTKLARIDAGEIQLRRQWSSIAEVITVALKRAEPRTRANQIEVWIEDELPSVRIDERAVAEVVYTLVDNAAKYSPPGTPIRVRAAPGDNETMRLSVEDEGPGIP